MKNRIIPLLLILISCSFLFFGCSKISDRNVKIIDKAFSKAELSSCIRLGKYKDIKIKKPAQKAITEQDIDQQIDYALKNTGESKLTKDNVKAVSGYDTVAEYKQAVKQNLINLNKSSQNNELMNKAWDNAIDHAVLIKCPKNMLEKEISEVKANYQSYAGMMGISYKAALKQLKVTQKDIESKAMNYVKSDLLIYAIAKAENITISDSEYDAEVQKRMKFFRLNTIQELADKLGAGNDLHFVFLADKVMKFVYDNARVEA